MRVLFLCTGNSCRSQMAEGWARALAAKLLGKKQFEFASAGLQAYGLNPRAIAVMAENGIDITLQTSDVLTDAMLAEADLVISVCTHAGERCPLLPAGTLKRHMPFDDPAAAIGEESEIKACFQNVCERIRVEIEILLHELTAKKV